MNLRFLTLPAALAASSLMLASTAKADTFAFTITTPGSYAALNASGTFTTVADAANPLVQDITSVSGTLTNGALTGSNAPATLSLIAVQPGQSAANPSVVKFDAGYDPTAGGESYFYLYYDNYLGSAGSLFDGNGLGVTASNGISYEFGAYNGGYAYEAFNNSENFDQRTFDSNAPAVNITVTPLATAVTPEPGSLTLLATGLLGTAGLLRRKLRFIS